MKLAAKKNQNWSTGPIIDMPGNKGTCLKWAGPFCMQKKKAERVRFLLGIHRIRSYLLLFFSSSCIFIARTFSGRPNSVMNPSASW